MTKLLSVIFLLMAITFNCYAQTASKTDSVPREARQYMTNGYNKFQAKDYAGAAKEWEKALTKVNKYGKEYESLLSGLAYVYDEIGDKQNLNRIMTLVDGYNTHELSKPCNEPDCMSQRAQYYASKGDNAKAKECFLSAIAMPMTESVKAKVDEAYGNFLGFNESNFGAGADYLLSAANINKKLNGVNENYAQQMFTVGQFAFVGKKYDMAVNAYLSALDFYSKSNTPEAKKMVAKTLKFLGNAYSSKKDSIKALECYQKLVDFYAKNDTANAEYPKAILSLAKQEKFNKDYDASIAHHKQAMRMFKQRGMTVDYGNAANSLKLCYAYAGKKDTVETNEEEFKKVQYAKLDSLINIEKSNLEITRQHLGRLAYASALGTIAGAYMAKKDYSNSINYYGQYIPAIREALRDEFRMKGENDRMIVWNNEKNNIADIKDMLLKLSGRKDALTERLDGIAYDTELLSKGILLNSSIEFEKVLQGIGNKQLIADYQQLKANEDKVETLRKRALSQADLDNILQLERQNQELQLKLYRGCAEYADFTNYISYTWQDVQKQLKDGDIAIEFVLAGDSPLEKYNKMMALILTKNSKTPEAVIVNEDSVWVVLQPWLASAKRVFFSADGNLNRIAIEYMPYGGKPISEQFEVYRLSSTKELCYKHNAKPYTNVAIFGDINYNEDGTMTDNTKRSLKSLQTREGGSSYADLSNTKREINAITTILKAKGVKKVVELSDTEASRDAFMKLDNSKIDVLHVATHGTYKDIKKSTDADAMNNSILAFAGANLDKSGLVTAADIAKMNLRQCDLAVLSACETGLGKLSGDGVFGLQRGLKNAGVHTLLMSLRDVYDNTTADMMISFYRYLMNGSTKREALIKAQKNIRDNGHADPKYWATFILLDALD